MQEEAIKELDSDQSGEVCLGGAGMQVCRSGVLEVQCLRISGSQVFPGVLAREMRR